MKEIILTKGKVALVDDADYESLSQFKWHAKPDKRTTYAGRMIRVNGEQITIRIHQEIMKTVAMKGIEVDHKDGNGLNNQRFNLRVCTRLGNVQNRGMNSRKTKSGFKGVSWSNPCGKWKAQIANCKKIIHLGVFDNKESAALAYNVAAFKYFGEFAKPNELR